jgi:hypothetical protein
VQLGRKRVTRVREGPCWKGLIGAPSTVYSLTVAMPREIMVALLKRRAMAMMAVSVVAPVVVHGCPPTVKCDISRYILSYAPPGSARLAQRLGWIPENRGALTGLIRPPLARSGPPPGSSPLPHQVDPSVGLPKVITSH